MSRGAKVLATLIVALAIVGGVIVATTGKGRTSPASAALTTATTGESSASTGARSTAPAGIDPNDPALVFPNDDPCAAPCSKLNVVYGSAAPSVLNPAAGAQALSLDLYRSAKTPKRDAPVVVLLHGGGFVEGTRTQMRVAGEVLANAGFLVASIQYRLVPKDRNRGAGIAKEEDIPIAAEEAMQDTQMAMRYLRRHAAALGATKEQRRYAVGGYSAGAIAALRVALRGGDKATPAARRWTVGAGFAIAGFECGSWTKNSGCRAAYDEADPPIQIYHGEADSIVSFSWGRDTCTNAVLRGGGCDGFFYPDQDHFWSSGTMFGGAKNLTRRQPAIFPTVAKFLRGALAKR